MHIDLMYVQLPPSSTARCAGVTALQSCDVRVQYWGEDRFIDSRQVPIKAISSSCV